MIAKISELKQKTTQQDIKSLCETTIAAMSSAIYNRVTPEARFEIERAATENLFNELSKYSDDKIIKEWLDNEKRLYSIKNIGVRKAINSLKENEAKIDPTLFAILEYFEEKINHTPEVLIYEEFISALAGEYNWVSGVTTQLDAISNRVNNYKHDIDISKIIETMKSTRSNYLLPLIEDVVNGYINNKTEQSRSHLKETLNKFSYDPFIKDIINIVMLDATDLQLDYTNEGEIEKVYSPLMHLGENEVAFNIKGTFYIKKGNNINKIKKSDVEQLDENFRGLCEAINVPNVELSKKEIKVYVNNDLAIINENSITINDKELTNEAFKNAVELSQWAGNTNFYMLAGVLHENFNEIVEVDFAKHVYLKEDESHSADVIKLRNNIFITTYDTVNNKATFYRNINPIQAEKVMMEHMRFDVSKTFVDILPNKEKILTQINEAKKAYIEYIANLNEKINEYQNTPNNLETISLVIEALQEELRDVKNEYKDYVNEIEKYTNISENIVVSLDVDGEKYTVPIPTKTSTAKGEVAPDQAGTVVGAELMDPSPATEITFDDDKTELLGDSPSIQDDEVDLGVDNVEAAADAAEASTDDEVTTVNGDGEAIVTDEPANDMISDEPDEDKLGLGEEPDAEDAEEDLGEEPDAEEDEDKKEESLKDNYDEDKVLNDEEEVDLETPVVGPGGHTPDGTGPKGDGKGPGKGEGCNKEIIDETPEDFEETPEDDIEIEKTDEENVEVEDAEVVTKAESPKVFLVKAKTNESQNLKKKSKNLNETQIGDTVMYNKDKGYVIGQTNDGDLLVQIQGSSHKVKPSEVKEYGNKPKAAAVQYKFDKVTQQNLTTKALFEQYVKCGIYMNNTPIKLNNCAVRFKEWNDAKDDDPINVLIEGRNSLYPKAVIRILEDVNDFANIEDYVEGVLIDEQSKEAIENIMINVNDFTQAIGDSDEVRIIKDMEVESPQVVYAPAALVRTLSV